MGSERAACTQFADQVTLVIAKVSEKLAKGLSFGSLSVPKPVLAY